MNIIICRITATRIRGKPRKGFSSIPLIPLLKSIATIKHTIIAAKKIIHPSLYTCMSEKHFTIFSSRKKPYQRNSLMYSFIFSARVSSVLPEFLFKIAIIFSVTSFSLVKKLKFFCASVSVTDSDTVSVTVETLVGGSIEGLGRV